jgi:hypothetical protein
MSANERKNQDCGKHRQPKEERAGIRTLENKPNPVHGHISGHPAANDNSKAWPLIPFPHDWYSS